MSGKRAYRPIVLENLERRVVLSHMGISGPIALFHHGWGRHGGGHHGSGRHGAENPQQETTGNQGNTSVGVITLPSVPASIPMVPTLPVGSSANPPAIFVATPPAIPRAAPQAAIDSTPPIASIGAAPATPVPAVRAIDPSGLLSQTLSMADQSAARFNDLFQPLGTAPAMSSPFQFQGAPVSGSVHSQVFQGTGAAAGLYAYAYQISLKDVAASNGQAVELRGVTFKFDDTPVGTDLTGTGHATFAYMIRDEAVGGLNAPAAASGQSILAPSRLNWEPNTLADSALDASFGTAGLLAGATSATVVVLSHQAPTQQFVGIVGADPIDPSSAMTSAYMPLPGTISTIPAIA